MIADTQAEGIRDRNFFATDLLGPFLILNPDYARFLFKEAGFSENLPSEDQMKRAAEIRFQDFERTFCKKKKPAKLLQTYLQKESHILVPPKNKDKTGKYVGNRTEKTGINTMGLKCYSMKKSLVNPKDQGPGVFLVYDP